MKNTYIIYRCRDDKLVLTNTITWENVLLYIDVEIWHDNKHHNVGKRLNLNIVTYSFFLNELRF